MANESVGTEYTGFSTSIAITALMFGALVTPPVFGLLADWTETYSISMVLIATMTLLAGLLSSRIGSDVTEKSG